MKYRVVRKRKEGVWALELAQSAKPHYSSRYLIKIQFGLNHQSFPCSFHVARGSDNKVFNSEGLKEQELPRILFAHFSRVSCGSSVEDDLQHMRELHEKDLISDSDYAFEKRQLLSNKHTSKLYVLPRTPTHVVMKKEARLRMLFVVFCVVLMSAILMCARMYETSSEPVIQPDIILKR